MAEVNQNSTVLTPKINRHKQPNKNSSAPFNLSFTKPSPVSFKQPRPLLSPKYTHQSPKQGSNVISTPNRKQHSFSNPSPKSAVKAASKPKKFDRFIPNRSTMDLESSQYHIQSHRSNSITQSTTQFMDTSTIAYQEEIAKACGVALDKRILSFTADPPPSHNLNKLIINQSWNRPLRHITKRKIAQAPEKVLDAPGLLDDYYLNLLDWSSKNVLAIALDKNVYVWNADSGDVVDFCSTLEHDYISSLQFTNDGSFLAIGTFNGDTQIYDIESNSKVRTMKGHSSRVSVLSWDKHLVSSGARDGSIHNHDVRAQKHKVSEFKGHSAEVCGLKWRPDGQILASGGNDNLVNIWDARSSAAKYTLTEHTAAVKAIAWCPWQLSLLSTGGGSFDRHIHFWNTSSGQKTASLDTGSQVTSIIWSKEYKEFLTSHGFPNNHLSLWSYPTLNKITDLPGHDERVLHSAMSPDGQTVATVASDENLKFWKCFESKQGGNAVKARLQANEDALVAATRRLAIR